MKEVKENKHKWSYWFLLGLSLIIIYKMLDNFSYVTGAIKQFLNTLAPFFVGILIAYILYMPCKRVESAYIKSKNKFLKKRARTLSIVTVYIIVALIIIILTTIILPIVWQSVIDLINNSQYYYTTIIDKYNGLPDDSGLKNDTIKEAISNIQNIDIKQYFKIENIQQYISKAIKAVTGVFNVFVAIVVSIYVLAERRMIINAIRKLTAAIFDEETYKNIDKYYNHSNEIFFDFVASQFVDAIIVGILTSVAMSVMKIKYAPLLGFFIGLFNMIPYIGAIIAVAISAVITIITGGLTQAIWMLVVIIIIQQIDANIINPKIVGQSLKMSPLLVLLAVTIGGAYFGIIGMFLSVPIVAIIKIIIGDYVNLRLERNKKKAEKSIYKNNNDYIDKE